jgi:hypothetical protein
MFHIDRCAWFFMLLKPLVHCAFNGLALYDHRSSSKCGLTKTVFCDSAAFPGTIQHTVQYHTPTDSTRLGSWHCTFSNYSNKFRTMQWGRHSTDLGATKEREPSSHTWLTAQHANPVQVLLHCQKSSLAWLSMFDDLPAYWFTFTCTCTLSERFNLFFAFSSAIRDLSGRCTVRSISRRHGCRESQDELDLKWNKSELATRLVWDSELAGPGLGDDYQRKWDPATFVVEQGSCSVTNAGHTACSLDLEDAMESLAVAFGFRTTRTDLASPSSSLNGGAWL